MLYFICKPRSQSLEEERRDTESMMIEVQCEVSTVSDGLGRYVVCWCCSTVFSEVHSQRSIYQNILEHFMLPSADKLYREADFIFQQDLPTLPTVPKAGSMTMCYCAWLTSKLAWPEPQREYRWETPDPTMQMTWRPLSKQPVLHYTWAVPQTDHLHATPHRCSNSRKRSPNQVLSA